MLGTLMFVLVYEYLVSLLQSNVAPCFALLTSTDLYVGIDHAGGGRLSRDATMH